MAHSNISVTALLAVLLLSASFEWTPIEAWGRVGHKTIADIAWYQLSSKARKWVSSVLALELEEEIMTMNTTSIVEHDEDYQNYTSPLAEVSIWADDIRQLWPYKWTTPLHYVNVHRSSDGENSSSLACPVLSVECQFDYDVDCPNDICAVGAIANYTQRMIMANEGSERHHYHTELEISSQEQAALLRGRRKAHADMFRDDVNLSHAEWIAEPVKSGLYFVTHLVGDIHQPLHVSRAEDEGGNSIAVYFPTHAPGGEHEKDSQTNTPNLQLRKTNLHSVWDDDMIERAMKEDYGQDRNNFTAALLARLKRLSPEEESKWLTPSEDCASPTDLKCVASEWAVESMELALYIAYVDEHLNEFPNTHGETDRDNFTFPVISEEYYKTRLEVAERRLLQAGLRLAKLIEDVVEAACEGAGGCDGPAHY